MSCILYTFVLFSFYSDRQPRTVTLSNRAQITASSYACPTPRYEQHSCNSELCTAFMGSHANTHFCHCDKLCMQYSDCCPNYVSVCQAENVAEEDSSREFEKCIQTVDFHPESNVPRSGHFLISLCPNNWTDNSGIRDECQKDARFEGLLAIPVQGPNGRHYKNIYCALCHGLQPDDVLYWTVAFIARSSFNTISLNDSQILNLDKYPVLRQLFNKELKPPYLENTTTPVTLPRTCIVLNVRSCPVSDIQTADTCSQHYAPIVWNGQTYKNIFCTHCNVSFAQITQLGIDLDQVCEIDASGRGTTMAVIMIFSGRTDTQSRSRVVTKHQECSTNQVYDPFLAFCRNLICPDGLFLTENGERCAEINKEVNAEAALTVTGSFRSEFSMLSPAVDPVESWETVARKVADDFLISVLSYKHYQEESNNKLLTDDNMQVCDNLNLTWICSMDDTILTYKETCLTSNLFTCSVNVSFNCEAPPIDRLSNFNRVFSDTCFEGKFWNNTVRLDVFTISAPCTVLLNETKGFMNDSDDDFVVATSELTYSWDDYSGYFRELSNASGDSCRKVNFECPLLKFSKDEYAITGTLNDSIRLIGHDIVFQKGEFKLHDTGDVEVCRFLPEKNVSADVAFGNLAHIILTIGGTSVSLIGMVVTITTYVAFPILRRNVAGKSLMSLVASLFFAQITMLVGE